MPSSSILWKALKPFFSPSIVSNIQNSPSTLNLISRAFLSTNSSTSTNGKRLRRIDVHHHIAPEFYAEAVETNGGDPSGWPTPKWSLEQAKQAMSELDIDLAILSITAPGPKIFHKTGEKSRAIARKLNDYSAKLVQENPKEFGFFASLPLLDDVDGALREIDYAHSILKADGFTLFTSYGDNLYLGHSVFQPIWQRLNQLETIVFVHPSEAPTTIVNRFMPQPLVDYPHETTRTAADIVLSGTRAAFPNVKIILPHAGGTLPFLAQRIAGAGVIPFLGFIRKPEEILSDFRSFYYDTTLSSSALQLNALLDFADPKKILFGTDIPYASTPWIRRTTEAFDDFFRTAHKDGAIGKLWQDISRNNATALLSHKIKANSNSSSSKT